MKNVKILLATVCVTLATAAMAQQDFSDPKYAAWGATPQEREQNILNSNFLKEACDNRDYNQAAHYLKALIDKCPGVQMSIYQRGATVYKNKINTAKTPEQRKIYVDSLMLMYDLRDQYFGSHPKYGTPYILDQKAREVLTYMPNDRAAIRDAFKKAIEAGGESTSPETVVVYFSNLCEDYKNKLVQPEEIIAEYDRLSPLLANSPDFKSQFDTALGLSGAASCETLEKLFKDKLAAAPNDEALLAQAVALMSRAKCDSEFYFATAEKYYKVKPSSETALFLAQAFQNKGEYAKATKYLNEALSTEKDSTQRQNLLVRIALVELVAGDVSGAASAARQARELNPEDGVAYFVLAQCYASSAAACGGFAGQATFWAAYDTMSRAVELLPGDSEYMPHAKSALGSYRAHFPSQEECFFNELQNGSRYTVSCGTAAGIVTTVRPR